MAEIAMDHPYATWPSVLALAVLVLTCIICVVRRRNFKKPTKTYVYKPLLDQEGTCYSFISRLHSGFFWFFLKSRGNRTKLVRDQPKDRRPCQRRPSPWKGPRLI